MKNRVIAALAAVLVITLGLRIYLASQPIGGLNHQSRQDSLAESPQAKIPKRPNPALPKPGADDEFLKDHPSTLYKEAQRMQNEMDRVFGDSFSRFHPNTPLGSLSKTPEVDLQEKPDRYIVTLNAPGADESSLDVKLEGRQLHISIRTEHARDQTDDGNGRYSYHERFMGEFHSALTLPGSANAAKMTADYLNGVLTITIPKS